ncbi:tRNA lysidine(34) synthetase TilS [Actinoallomurus iriomotensis]|uniref:tRNA(Ile)-lysidine synthase n=1 Tax=Actinoallomurus iriomotensis TaxID=478107 RepID=A0A9W6VX21_9ACTN|nr:tRNA(Ile)-lysidine synthase [Actinoallomurus iriomotensis]
MGIVGPDPAVAAVRLAVRRALATVEAGDLVLVACSGGADSLALAGALAFEAARSGHQAGGVTVDHGLQDGSAERAAAVVGILTGLGLEPAEVRTVTVGSEGGVEAAARTARYEALDAAAAGHRAAAVLLGHTLDDQAETVLLGLARGSGARSLAGMPAVSGIYRRPLLELGRDLTRRACLAMGLTPWDDPHNQDHAFARARVRGDVLPALEKGLGPGITAALARTARMLRDDADALDAWAAETQAAEDEPGAVRALGVRALAGLPRAVRTRVLHRTAIEAGSPPGTLAAVHVDAVDALVTAWRGQSYVDLPGRVRVWRRYEKLLFGPSETPRKD